MSKLICVVLMIGMAGYSFGQAAKRPQPKPQCAIGEIREGGMIWNFDHSIGTGDSDWVTDIGLVSKCANGKWVEDEEATKVRRALLAEQAAKEKAIADHHKDLWNALRTRVVTDEEMKEILELGTEIVPGGGTMSWCGGRSCGLPQNYREVEQNYRRDAEIILNNALLNQFKMRVFANQAKEQP